MHYLRPNPAQIQSFRSGLDPETPVTMLNLLRYREIADYSEHPDEAPCSGAEAYARYSALAVPCVEAHGGRVRFSGQAKELVIGPETECWDAVILVDYPSVQAFIAMANSDRYQAIAYHRTAALEDSRLLPIV